MRKGYRDLVSVKGAFRLLNLLKPETQVVLLGSIATPKYVFPFVEVFGERLRFPRDFVGRGNMSWGGLLLRCCFLGLPLDYDPVLGLFDAGGVLLDLGMISAVFTLSVFAHLFFLNALLISHRFPGPLVS